MEKNTIFVSIACFMDEDIVNTIDDCLKKAKYPEKICFGVCLQYDPEDNFFSKYDNHPRVKIKRMHWKEARGPTFARYYCTQLVTDEEYFLQIDCHSRFFQDWDEIAIQCILECNDESAILTNFPIPISKMDAHLTHPSNISTPSFQHLSKENIKLGSVTCSLSSCHRKTYYLSAALLFGPTQFVKEVPYDPHLVYSYQNIEQQFYAVRLFSHDWNLYAPSKHILATTYEKTSHFDKNAQRVFAPSNVEKGKQSWKRTLYQYGLISIDEVPEELRTDITQYGLGNNRSLEDYFSIHNQSGALEKIKNNTEYYKNKIWHSKMKTYSSMNIILRNILKNNDNFQEKKEGDDIDFCYDIKSAGDYKLQHYPAKFVTFIDNKKTLYKLLETNNINEGIPITYFNIDDILPNKTYELFFLKYAGNNGGKQVHLYNDLTELRNHIVKDKRPYIIQKEVENMLLINNKKFVLRIWIVILNGNFYLSSNGCCIIHSNDYNKDNLNRFVHIEHNNDCVTSIDNLHYNKCHFYENSFQKLKTILKSHCLVLKNELHVKSNCFQILGLDVIFNNEYNPYIIEYNSWPNLSVQSGTYYEILKEFFTRFTDDIVIPKLNNEPISGNDYFISLS